MNKCPRCGSTLYYEKHRKTYKQYFNWDGTVSHASDGKNYGGKRKYCGECDLDVTKHFPYETPF